MKITVDEVAVGFVEGSAMVENVDNRKLKSERSGCKICRGDPLIDNLFFFSATFFLNESLLDLKKAPGHFVIQFVSRTYFVRIHFLSTKWSLASNLTSSDYTCFRHEMKFGVRPHFVPMIVFCDSGMEFGVKPHYIAADEFIISS